MRIGVDSSVLVAALHANHPLHATASRWLHDAIPRHDLFLAPHSLLETYAVLTRLPGRWRVSPEEARHLLESVRPHVRMTGAHRTDPWIFLERMASIPVAGGAAYDFLIAETLHEAGVQQIATLNAEHFRRVAPALALLDLSAHSA